MTPCYCFEKMLYILLTTVKSQAEANKLGQRIISEKLAACVSAVPNITSTYRWRGRVERSSEVMLIVKTSSRKLSKLMKRVKELHTYAVPEILILKVERGLPQYLKWVEESLV